VRPKKVILCVDANEIELSVLAFLLSTHGYRVLSASTPEDAVHLVATELVDAALIRFALPGENGAMLAARLRKMSARMAVGLLCDSNEQAQSVDVLDFALIKKACPDAELIDKVRILAAGKRGPRKGSRPAPPVMA